MKKLLLIISLFICILFSCVPRNIKDNFNKCYTGSDTGIEKKLNLMGVFSGDIINLKDTATINIILFKDGTFVTIPGYLFKKILFEKGSLNYNLCNNFTCYWGSYNLEGDTIKAQSIKHHGFWDSWMGSEEWYLIIDKNIIKRIYFRKFGDYSTDKKNHEIDNSKFKPLLFIGTEKAIEMENWLMNEKWFWCNEKDYYEFKKQQKINKK